MHSLKAVSALALALAAPAASWAGLLAYEGLDGTTYVAGTSLIGTATGGAYPAGGVLAGNTTSTGGASFGWSGNWLRSYADPYTNGLAVVSSNGLSSPAGAAAVSSAGKAATITTPTRTNAQSTSVGLATASALDRSQPVYVSFLFSRPATDPNNNIYLALTSDTGSEMVQIGSFSQSPAQFGVKIGTVASRATSTALIPDSSASLVVAKLDYGTPTAGLYTNMALTLWVNPTSDNEAAQTTVFTLNGINAAGFAPVGGIRLSADYKSATPSPANTATFDEVRLGTAFRDVVPVPEPMTLGVLGAAGSGIMLRRSRR